MFATSKEKSMDMADNMVNEGGRTAADAKEAARQFKSDARETVHAVRDDLEEMARRTGRHVREFADSAGQNVTELADSMTGKIRHNPVQSSVIALAVGFFVGMIYRRR